MKNLKDYLPLYILAALLIGLAVWYFLFRDKVPAPAINTDDADTYKALDSAAPNLGTWFYETVLARYKDQKVADVYKGSKSGSFMAVLDSSISVLKINGTDPIDNAKHEELWKIYNDYRAKKSYSALTAS